MGAANRTPLLIQCWRGLRLFLHLLWGIPAAALLPLLPLHARNRLVRFWSRSLLALLNVRLRCCGSVPADLSANRIVVANHLSWLDIFAINSVHATRFIAKAEIRHWPVLGWLAHQSGALFIRQKSRRDALRIVDQVRAALQPDTWLGFFPEGGIGNGEALQTFHAALFEPVTACQARLSAIAIRYIYPDGSVAEAASYFGINLATSALRILGARAIIAELDFTAPIETAGKTRRQLKEDARGQIATALGLPAAADEG